MIGDKLVITEYHKQAAAQAMATLEGRLTNEPIGIAVSGESGSGKSETAQVLGELLEAKGKKVVVLGQDDYFKLPPKTNGAHREKDISWVGSGEVKLDVMDANMKAFKGAEISVEKPLVYFEEDRITEETLGGGPYDVVIAEGTYTSLIESVDFRVFIDRTYHQTKKARIRRARDEVVGFIEQVLEIEHKIISAEKSRADVVIAPPPEELGLD